MNVWTDPGPFKCSELAAACRVGVRFIHERVADGTIRAGRIGRVIRISATEARRIARDLGVEPAPDRRSG